MLSYYSRKYCDSFDLPARDLVGAVVTCVEGDEDKDVEYLEITLKDGRKMSVGSGRIGVDSLNMSIGWG